jgi:hypothetical protein
MSFLVVGLVDKYGFKIEDVLAKDSSNSSNGLTELATQPFEYDSVEEKVVLSAISVLSRSPMCKDITSSSYEVKEVSGGFAVMFDCGSYTVYSFCKTDNVTPYMFRVSRELSYEESQFFRSLGEVDISYANKTTIVYYN